MCGLEVRVDCWLQLTKAVLHSWVRDEAAMRRKGAFLTLWEFCNTLARSKVSLMLLGNFEFPKH